MGNRLYVYKRDSLSREELYLKKCLMSFIKDLSYPGGVIPWDEASRKCLKRLIDTRLLMDTDTMEDRKNVFCIILDALDYFITNSLVFNVLTLLMVFCRFNKE